MPEEIKQYGDASQSITLEPCWQMDKNDPGYCEADAKHCKDFRYHMRKIKNPCGQWCSEHNPVKNCKISRCSGCPFCHSNLFYMLLFKNSLLLFEGLSI